MNFDFTAEHEQFRHQIRRFFERAAPLQEVRSILEGKVENYSVPIWKGIAELGIPSVTIPEEHGGLGLGAVELCLAAEEVGRALAPIPFLSSVCVFTEAVRLFGSAEQKAKWLPGLADGSVIGTWASDEGHRLSDTKEVRIKSGRISGTLVPVLDGMIAKAMVVLAKNEQRKRVLVLCDLEQSGVERKRVPTIDASRPAARVELSDARVEPLTAEADAVQKLLDRAAVLLAFEQLGSAESALSMAREYALERGAFGRKIGSFQAIKHKLADVYAKIELARCHCYYGAWAISTEAPEMHLAAAGARCSATDALEHAAQENIQIHGGIGVTWECNCQLFYRRSRLNALILGSRDQWEDRLVAELEARVTRSIT
jgi:acyl-CoA dehydrogenase